MKREIKCLTQVSEHLTFSKDWDSCKSSMSTLFPDRLKVQSKLHMPSLNKSFFPWIRLRDESAASGIGSLLQLKDWIVSFLSLFYFYQHIGGNGVEKDQIPTPICNRSGG